jgi:Na+-transporting NADH:ubiquinone oxidoreductase subunit C
MANNRESIGNTLKVAFLVCLVCAVVVSTLAVVLRPAQHDNRMQFRQQNILQGRHVRAGMDVRAAFENIERRFVDIAPASTSNAGRLRPAARRARPEP